MNRETIPLATKATTLLTEAEAIDRLALGDRPNPVASIRWLVRVGRLKAVRIGRGILRYHPDDVAQFIEASRA